MTPERVETSSTTVEESLGLLNPKGTAWRNITMFSKRQPLGAFGAVVAIVLILVAIFAPLIATHDPLETNVSEFKFAGPGTELWLGGDQLGRDVFSRLVYGARISLLVGILSVVFGVTGGFIIGVVSGYFGGKTDLYLQRIMDAMIAFPALILALAIMAVLGPSIQNVIIALTVVFIPGAARTIRAETLRIKEMDYVLAARSVGAADWRIMMRHIAPNCFAMYIVLATISLGWAIIVEASLSFLGAGIPPNIPSWGGMLSGATQQYVEVGPWLAVFPGLAIAIVVFAWNLLGDSLRDVLDPRLRGST
jgi:ABC-type dipeptide/oligopeptide/nickel transport system permease subunit